MRIIRTKDYQDMSHKAADVMSAQVILKPNSVLGLATGSTPLGMYKKLIEWNREGGLDFSGVTTINLDEYDGLPADNDQSYRYFMRQNLFDHINIKPENNHLPDGLAADPKAECARYDALIAEKGIDMQLLGLGHNGHIGFNEPGDSFVAGTHRVALTESTIQANKRFFASADEVPRHAYTMGIQAIMQAKRILVVVSGQEKAQIVRDALCGPITPAVPASILQLHPNVVLVGDTEALSLI
ncbi:glucosamine-6-phosphate deaminase [Ruminococcaceae bacterium OttesenSCG-928-D13]|nr:glucosamine-6-phosphate deaminase [Ruminococcaceae bacterium OttesenSCG-928-D13]